MCIRDRLEGVASLGVRPTVSATGVPTLEVYILNYTGDLYRCLLYTSDAADERSSVDLGGRRIIKKKNNTLHTSTAIHET